MSDTMIPTRESTIKAISELSDSNYTRVALFVQSISNEDRDASENEVMSATKLINEKYANVFRKLAQ